MDEAAPKDARKFLGDTSHLHAPRLYQSGGLKSMGQMSSEVKTKIAKAPVEKALVEKTAGLMSTSSAVNVVNAVRPSAGTILGAGAAMGGVMLATSLFGELGSAIKKTIDNKMYAKTLDKAVEINPKLKAYDMKLLRNYYNLIADSSPTVAKNPLLVSNYLQYMLDHEGSMNFMAYKGLVDMEGQLMKNQEAANPIQTVAQKSLVDNVIRMALPNVQYKMDLAGPKDHIPSWAK